MKLFLDYGRDINQENSQAIYTDVCSNGNVECLKLLLKDERLKPDNRSAISSFNNIECFKLFLQDERIDPAGENSFLLRSVLDWTNQIYYTRSREKGWEIIGILMKDGRARASDVAGRTEWRNYCYHQDIDHVTGLQRRKEKKDGKSRFFG